MNRDLVRPLPRSWWLRKPPYFRFMARELTSVAVLAYSALIIAALWSVGDPDAFSGFYEFLNSPLSIWLHVGVLALALFHTGTWIALTPKVMVIWQGDHQLDPDLIAGWVTLLFLVVSGGLLWLALA
ncbi:MAG: hypothetical protein WD269_09290 [Acidimicrobiia bacterium]